MPRAYATFVVGDKDVIVYDDKLSRVEAKTVIVSQPAMEGYDNKQKKHTLDLGKMIIRADGRTYECIDFKRFQDEAERSLWVEQEKTRMSGGTP